MPGEFGSEDQKTYWPVSTLTTDTPVNTSNLETSGTSNGGITPYRPANEVSSSVDQPLNPFHAHIAYITNKTFPGLIKQETLDKIGDSFSYGGQSNLLSKVNSPQEGGDGTVIKADTTNGNSASILPDEKFSHEGNTYVRRNGQLFRSENVIPGKLTELSPDVVAGIGKGQAGVTATAETGQGNTTASKAQGDNEIDPSLEGFTPNPGGPNTYKPPTIGLRPLTPAEQKVAAHVTGSVIGTYEGVKGALPFLGNPGDMLTVGAYQGVKGYGSGYGLAKLGLENYNPAIVPYFEKK